jgi:hypothetical protein
MQMTRLAPRSNRWAAKFKANLDMMHGLQAPSTIALSGNTDNDHQETMMLVQQRVLYPEYVMTVALELH